MPPQPQEFAYDVLLSHNSADKPRVREIAEKLKAAGLKVWFDEWSIEYGEQIHDAVRRGLKASRKIVFCVSPAAVASDWVTFETASTLFPDPMNRKLRFLPLLLEDCTMPSGLEGFKYIDARGSDDGFLPELIGACRPEDDSSPDGPSSGGPNVSIARLPNTGPHMFGRDPMLRDLDHTWADDRTNVIALVAGGGVGKSALVNHWLAAMGQDNYRGARRVYGHSFYSQGTSEGTASADTFFAEALAWFGDPDPTKGTAWARGERLAELVRAERTLLILDGMEPLQFPPGPNGGRVTDPGLQALLRELAARNPGLCVVTPREHVADLDRFAGTGAVQKNLEDLPNEAGAELLKELGVDGSPQERAKASKEFGNHALALTLLGTYLVKACGGDIRRRTEISLVDADRVQGGHARRVMESYEKWFTEHGREAELSILRMLGLFNRPAEAGCIAALRGGEPIADLTVGLAGISEAAWNIALSNLREAGLLAKADADTPGALDAHPLVREHFGERLEKDYPEAWRAGHERLYEYLKGPGSKKDLPDTAEEMAPLFAAVLHGCAAGRHQEAFREVYRRRIQRGEEFHSTSKLGAFGADLGALAGMFEEPWRRPVASLGEAVQAFVLAAAGFRLRALGRLKEAVEPMRAALEAVVDQPDWNNAMRYSGNLSELYLTLGRIGEAIDCAKQSVNLADRSEGAFERMVNQTTLANALHQAGRASEAQALFQEAERMQKGDQPEYPLLYSLRGYHYCELLLARGKHEEVIERVTQTLEWESKRLGLLNIALDHLSLGRALLLAAQAEGTDAYKKACAHLDLAVDGLREAGSMDHLPRGLLARAELYLFTGDHADAGAALNEALDIATRDPAGPMKLHVTDCHLGYARLALAEEKPEVARDELAQARALIKETGYHRRDEELAELEESVEGPRDPVT
jgi:tetratricopeptide (TPR) repeat protein